MIQQIKYLSLKEDDVNYDNLCSDDAIRALRKSLYINCLIDTSKTTDEELFLWHHHLVDNLVGQLYPYQKTALGIEDGPKD